MTQFLKIKQLNCHKSRDCSALLACDTAKLQTNNNLQILCLQEPHMWKSRVCGFQGMDVFFKRTPKIRAAIVIPRNPYFQAWQMPDFTSGDVVAITVASTDPGINDLIIASVYCDIELGLPSELERLVALAESENKRLIICADSNAHSHFWGDDCNTRGEIFEEFILTNNLEVINEVTIPTFIGRDTGTFIDITLSHGINREYIQNWKVHENLDFCSDHRMITFAVPLATRLEERLTEVVDVTRVDWTRFRAHLGNLIPPYKPGLIDEDWIEAESAALQNGVWTAARESSHVLKGSNSPKNPPYWDPQVDLKRRKLNKLFKKAIRLQTEDAWSDYKAEKKAFSKEVKLAKRRWWRELTAAVATPKDTARLIKSLQGKESQKIQLSLNNNNTGSPQAAAEHFIDTLFPGSVPAGEHVPEEFRFTTDFELDRREDVQFINIQALKFHVRSFKPRKTPGMDQIKPILLKQLDDETYYRLIRLYKACLVLRYIPKDWCASKVVIIPKPGKDDYSKPKSFRPISLSSFFFKLMEKVVKGHIENTFLTKKPLHEQQHAFRSGHSCDTALSVTVDCIESAITRGQYCLGVFLDISGAFDNLSIDAAIAGLRKRDIDPVIVDWYAFYLKNRTISANLNGIEIHRKLTRGTPQGGVLSPLVWNLAFDELLETCNCGPVKAVGFADDACLLIRSPDPHALVGLAQREVNRAVAWGAGVGLSFNAAKTVAVLFTQRNKIPTITNLKVDGSTVNYSNEVRYLGIQLDKKLNFNSHISNVIAKAKRFLLNIRSSIGKLWGPSPKWTVWAYNAMVKTMISYGSIIWSHRAHIFEPKLKKLQRLAMLLTTNVVKSTPTAGLEVFYGLPPLSNYIEQCGLSSYVRFGDGFRRSWDGIGDGNKRGHRFKYDKLKQKIKLPEAPLDLKRSGPSFNFKFSLESFDSFDESKFNSIILCTVTENVLIGWSLVFTINNIIINSFKGKVSMGSTLTQAATFAFRTACTKAKDQNLDKICFLIDSRALYDQLSGPVSDSLLVAQCWDLLNSIVADTPVSIILDNKNQHPMWKTAQPLAKEAIVTRSSPMAVLPVRPTEIKTTIKLHFLDRWDQEWKNPDPKGFQYRQSRRFWPHVDTNLSKQLLQLERPVLSRVLQLISGHGYNAYHRSLVDPSTDSECRYCMEDDEDSWHIVNECPAFDWLRNRLFELSGESNTILTITTPIYPEAVLRLPGFIREADIGSLFTPL